MPARALEHGTSAHMSRATHHDEQLVAFGVNHVSAPLDLRERLSIQKAQLNDTLRGLRAVPAVNGAFLLSTCNRTEVYLACNNGMETVHHALRWYLQERGVHADAAQHLYQLHGADAVRHVFRVATGLDSMVLGETQILGQLKDAYADAKAADAIAPSLDRLLQQSFSVAKIARTDSKLGENPVSVASSAVHVARQIFDDFEHRSVLLIGAGETATLLAKHLQSHGVRKLCILNRSFDRAQQLALELNAQAAVMSKLGDLLPDADIIACATASEKPLITASMLSAALKKSKRRAVLCLDLGVPRNIDSDCKNLRDVFLYHVDDLRHVVDQSLAARKQAALVAEALVESHAKDFMAWLGARERFDTMIQVRRRVENKRDAALALALNEIEHGAAAADVVRKLAFQLSNQFLHDPTEALKKAATEQDLALLDAAQKLFRMDR